ncbi:keratin-associated protein 9-1-like [Lineus longissimus]|uniref:keratin-associated protein 9-1-like n=1 Tax=Lineus longissimus TaxID=88925 RepID=UPI002B4F34B1
MAVNSGLIWQQVIFLSQFAGFVLAASSCQGGAGQFPCTNPASPKCCYSKCCPESDFSKFPFSKCPNSASPRGAQTCLQYHMTSCCPYKIGSRDMGQSCCEPVTTYTSCPGISKTDYCTVRRETACCYTSCCAYWEFMGFPFSKCSGTRGAPARFTTETCYTYPNTQCCTLTHATGTKSSSVFCCSSRYHTDFNTYSSCLLLTTSSGCYINPHDISCSWTRTTHFCTHSAVARCCAYGCCNSPSFSTCGLWYPWSTHVCSDFRSPSCCNAESKGNIVGQTCCRPSNINTHQSSDNQSTILGWTLGGSILVLIPIAVCAAHSIVRKRRARNRRPPTMELEPTSTTNPPVSGFLGSSIDGPPPSYESVQEQPPQYDQLIDNDQPPSYNDAVNPVFNLNTEATRANGSSDLNVNCDVANNERGISRV